MQRKSEVANLPDNIDNPLHVAPRNSHAEYIRSWEKGTADARVNTAQGHRKKKVRDLGGKWSHRASPLK